MWRRDDDLVAQLLRQLDAPLEPGGRLLGGLGPRSVHRMSVTYVGIVCPFSVTRQRPAQRYHAPL